MIHVAIVEDEEKMSTLLKTYFNKIMNENSEFLFSIDVYNDSRKFLTEFKSQYELILMDIEIPEINGMETAKKIREMDNKCTIIFVTYMAKYALKGYEVKAFDFIVKPVSYFSFSVKIQQAAQNIIKNKRDNVVLETKNGIRRMNISDIKYVEVSGHSVCIYTFHGEFQLKGTFSDAKKLLEPFYFLQCNVCYLVNPQHITLVTGDYVYINETELKISRPKKKNFLKNLAHYLEKFEGEMKK